MEAQELYCHECDRHVRFKIDMNLDGNHVLNCPNCGHEHCRVVKDGKITGDRWDSRNETFTISYSVATTTCFSGTNYFLTSSWATSSATWS